ncbi:MAG: carbohydrate kinase family protein, partial [Candidatus Limnocylindria bacterium]
MSPEAPAVLVIGDAMLDVSALPAGPVRDGQDVPAEIRVQPGGQGANVAVRLARRGVEVRLVCGIAEDAAGRILADALRDESVDVDPIRVPDTGIVVITLGPTGERTMLSQRQSLGAQLADRDIVEAAWAVLSGYVLLEAGSIRTAQRFAELRSIRVLAGCAVPEPARASWRAAAIQARPDLLIVNRDEAAWLDPTQDL